MRSAVILSLQGRSTHEGERSLPARGGSTLASHTELVSEMRCNTMSHLQETGLTRGSPSLGKRPALQEAAATLVREAVQASLLRTNTLGINADKTGTGHPLLDTVSNNAQRINSHCCWNGMDLLGEMVDNDEDSIIAMG